jgi:hypothetical protein
MIAQEALLQEAVPAKVNKTVDTCVQTSGLSIILIPTIWNNFLEARFLSYHFLRLSPS